MASTGSTPKQRLLLEISVALFLSAIYFWFVKDCAFGIPGNATNGQVFTAGSVAHFRLHELFDVWRGRLSGLMFAGWLFDLLVNHATGTYEQFTTLFGLYQATWLFALMLVVILALRHSLFINLGIFLGVMYNFFPICGLYFYPWDIPATLFFTLAILLFHQHKSVWMVAAICVGCFFKETVLVCALLTLFVTEWKWWRRILTFAGIAILYLAGKKFLLMHINDMAAALSMNDSKNLGDVIKTRVLQENFNTLFSAQGLYVVFANAGSMAAVLLFGWQRRFLPYMVLILAFIAGQSMYGAFLEFRIFMQILPLSLIILAERFWPAPGEEATPEVVTPHPGWALRNSIQVLPLLTILLGGLPTLAAGWQYVVIFKDKPASVGDDKPVLSEVEIQTLQHYEVWYNHGLIGLQGNLRDAQKNRDQEKFNRFYLAWDWFRRALRDKEDKLAISYQSLGRDDDAAKHYQYILKLSMGIKTNDIIANNLAWLLATSSDPTLRNGTEAVPLAELACQSTQHTNTLLLATLAAAYAEAGRFNDAITVTREAEATAVAQGQKDIAAKHAGMLQFYEAGRAYHQEPNAGQHPAGRLN